MLSTWVSLKITLGFNNNRKNANLVIIVFNSKKTIILKHKKAYYGVYVFKNLKAF